MRRQCRWASLVLSLLALLVVLPAAAQDWKGKGRLEGRVADQDGKPIEKASVKLRLPGRPDQGIDLKTDAKGRWAYLGLRGGDWTITIEAEGYVTGETVFNVSEVTRANPVLYSMRPVPKAEPVPTGLPPEIAEAVKAGNDALEQKRWADASAAFEKVLPIAPDNVGLRMALARAYSGDGKTEKAVDMLKAVTEKDPSNWGAWMLMANMLLEKGRLDEGRAALDQVPQGSVTDPNVFINVGVLFMNQKKSDEAETYFTKAIEVAPGQFDGYYFRGLARVSLHKNEEAQSDLSKVIELAPAGSSEAKEARELLEAYKVPQAKPATHPAQPPKKK